MESRGDGVLMSDVKISYIDTASKTHCNSGDEQENRKTSARQ